MKINKHSGNNSGSINKYYLIPCKGILKLVPSFTPGLMRLVTYSNIKAIELPLTPDKNGLTINEIEDVSGTYYDVSASGFIAGESPELANALGQLTEDYIVIARDEDLNYTLIGSSTEPVHIITSFSSGQTKAALKGSSLTLSRKSLNRPFLIEPPMSAGTGWAIYTPPGGVSDE